MNAPAQAVAHGMHRQDSPQDIAMFVVIGGSLLALLPAKQASPTGAPIGEPRFAERQASRISTVIAGLITHRDLHIDSFSSPSGRKTGYRDNWLFITPGWDLQEDRCTRWRLFGQVASPSQEISGL